MQAHKLFLLGILFLMAGLTGCGEADSSGSPSVGGSGSNDPDPNLPTTGIPDLDSFDIAVEQFNIESLNWSGETTHVTVRLADRLNENSVPDGTQVFFATRGGHIDEFCELVDGACSVTWTGTAPRPTDGLATILAWTTGNESFVDLDGDGIYTDGDVFNNGDFNLRDLSEPFFDNNFNGIRDLDEEVIDYDGDSVFDEADGLYNGVFCAHSTNCSPSQFLYIWVNTFVVMSGSYAQATVTPDPADVSGGPETLFITVTDTNGNPMPAGSTVEISAIGLAIGGSQTSFTYGNTLVPETYPILVDTDGTSGGGQLLVDVQTPLGFTSQVVIPVND